MTDDHQTTDEPALGAWPGGVFANLPGRAESLTPVNISREKHAPLIDMVRLGGPTAQRILGRLSCLHGGARDPNPWFTLWREHCGRYFDLDAA